MPRTKVDKMPRRELRRRVLRAFAGGTPRHDIERLLRLSKWQVCQVIDAAAIAYWHEVESKRR